jgi:hypothetical protein
MSENQNDDAQPVNETVDTAPTPVVAAKEPKPKTATYRVLFTSPFGRLGDEVDLDPKDSRVKRLLGNGGLEKV